MGELEKLVKEIDLEEDVNEEEVLDIIGETETKKKIKKPEKKTEKETPKQELKPELKLKLESSNEIWNTIAKRLDGIKDEFNLEMTKEGFRIKQTDDGNVILIDLEIPKSAFNDYTLSHNVKIGIDTQKLKKHLKIYSKDITVENGKNQLVFKGDIGQVSKMGLLAITDLDMQLPEIKYDVEVKTPAKVIQKMISIGEEFEQEQLNFTIKEKLFYIFVKAETDEVRFPICKINSLSDIKDFKSMYSIEYLKTVMKFKDTDELIINFGKDTPIRIHHNGKNEKVTFIIAPRIESD
jgi:hypothetical protein